MPGKYDSSNPAATFISAWAAYRKGLTAADDPTHPENVVAQVDLTKSFHGIDSVIRVFANKTAGTGTVDITLFLYNSGDLVTAVGWYQAATQANVATGTFKEFTGLTAGIYVVVITNIIAGAHWDLYVATNCGVPGVLNNLTGSVAAPPISTPLTSPLASDLTSKTPKYS